MAQKSRLIGLLVLTLVALLLPTVVFTEDEMSLHMYVVDPNLESSGSGGAGGAESVEDICAGLKCDMGERCTIDEGKPVCDCIDICEIPKDERQRICSTANNTYASDCHFLREKCWCKKNDFKCTDKKILNDKLDYYGECRFIDQCNDEQKGIFPDRMKLWLDEVLHILSNRKDLDSKYQNLVKMADEMKENKVEKYWTAGVIFEFCQLDKSKDHAIQKEELVQLISSIKALENCIQPFLNECDKDNNDMISDDEWVTCLDLSSAELQLLREKC